MADMLNMGKASVKVSLMDSLPNVTKDAAAFDMDQSALAWNYYMASEYAPPLLLEYVSDTTGQFGAIYPSKRKFFIDNHIVGSDGSPITANIGSEKIYWAWKPTVAKEGLIGDAIVNGGYDDYDLKFPPDYPTTYAGPRWEDKSLPKEAQPINIDIEVAKKWAAAINQDVRISSAIPEDQADTIPTMYSVNQTFVRDGLWWGIESEDSWIENTPFWVVINRMQSPPSNTKHETFIAISLGVGDNENAYDLVIANNKRPILFDYFNGRGTSTGSTAVSSYKVVEFPKEFAKITDYDKTIELGFMTVGGRLVVFVNKSAMMYRRIEPGTENTELQGTWKDAKISAGGIRVYGTNCQCTVNFCPMTFAPFGALILPFGEVPSEDGQQSTGRWSNIDSKGNTGSGSVIDLPNPEGKHDPPFGVDCAEFSSETCGSSNPSRSAGLHLEGTVSLNSAGQYGVSSSYNTFHVMIFVPEDFVYTIGGTDTPVPYSGCPYFFRVKGAYRQALGGGGGGDNDVTGDVLSVTETFSIDDYWAIQTTAQVTLYNKGGKYDSLRNQQKGIKIYWGWNGGIQQTFTGLVTSASSSEVPGKEELTLECSDYMFLLKNTQIVNSPYYDGMILFYACRDIIRRAGITEVINDWDDTDEYFLPTGYSFTKPAVKFDDHQMLYDCVKSLLERGEASFYFDEFGKCHIMKLPGGLFSEGVSSSGGTFVRNPSAQTSGGNTNTILDTKNVEYDYSDTVNRVAIYSLERDTRNPILMSDSAKGGEDMLIYRRLLYVQQPAFGAYRCVQFYMDCLKKRVFYPILKTSFKTVGTGATIRPLSFVQVDGQPFRLTGVSRKYNAENNEFTADYNAEWLGGK